MEKPFMRIRAAWENMFRINKYFTPARIIALGFAALILLGALLLHAPVSSRSGQSIPFLASLFTATSAVCVTGLIVVDTAATWSIFGRIVILSLIQIGGLGFMTIASIYFFIAKKKIGISQRMLMVQSLGLKDASGVVRLIRHVLIGTLMIEGVGALILTLRFTVDFGFINGLGMGVWHSVSAFCNAGFDLMGNTVQFQSLTQYYADPIINLTIMLLIIIGGLGFFVWEDILQRRKNKHLCVYSKLVIITTICLIVFGTVLIYFAESNNILTLSGMSKGEKLLASMFQAVSPRTAGFNTISQSGMTESSKAITMLLMFIGGSAGSTAGGIKTVTFTLLLISAFSALKSEKNTVAFKRSIPAWQIKTGYAVVMIAATLCFTGALAISYIDNISFFDALFETISGMATVGLTTGITPDLSTVPRLILIILMFFGRVGIMTIGLASLTTQDSGSIKRPETWIMLG